MDIISVTQNNFSKAIELLKQNKLPADDITNAVRLFGIYDNENLAGVIGLEHFNEYGLIRSLCVAAEKRNNGIADELLRFVEKDALAKGIQYLYLLTTTAAKYFAQRKYQAINRTDVPEAVKQTSQYASVCPSSAIIMRKILV